MRLGTTSLSVTKPGSVRKYAAAAAAASESVNFADVSDYSHVRFDRINVSSSQACYGIEFNNDGTIVYTLDGLTGHKPIIQTPLSTPYDISTHGASTGSIDTYAQGYTIAVGLRFKPDGTKLWVADYYGKFRMYNLSTAWDVTTASVSNDFYSPGGNITGFYWKPDGTSIYHIDQQSDKVYRREFSTAWDITSTVTTTSSVLLDLTTTTDEDYSRALYFSPDGLKLYICGYEHDKVYMYNLSTAWDITSSSFSGVPDDTLYVGSEEIYPLAITFNPTGKHMYIGGTGGDGVDQYSRP